MLIPMITRFICIGSIFKIFVCQIAYYFGLVLLSVDDFDLWSFFDIFGSLSSLFLGFGLGG